MPERNTVKMQLADGLGAVSREEWDSLAANAGLFMRHDWLALLEESGCAVAETGWQPLPLQTFSADHLAGAAPLYLKRHSRGEYVFDWAWAEAWQRAGLDYYPKLLLASPFTPVAGRRLLGQGEAPAMLMNGMRQLVEEHSLSSAHVLFPAEDELAMLAEAGWLVRHGVQFHWLNQGYADMDAFLASLTRDKRKKIRQERRKVADAGITVRALRGAEIGPADWRFFERCYRQTYLEHLSTPYLNAAFFEAVGVRMGEHNVLFIASRHGHPIAASWCLRDGNVLYGRYWGALETVDCLHFELCYYAGIDYAIREGLTCFEGGAQGEHKLARGFQPVRTGSAHWIAEPRFRAAIADWLARERQAVGDYREQLFLHSAYKTSCAGG
ncbi:GNAT family N-acetyltransferase [uncultured Aquitalea sp.]|uniref:GNAT family N-acetyltransferase n=2 Tax=uncultured Aquitalea sp. TaxID=540272 RepID=UPI0025D2B6F6|nr:GNAT family N-acetyltransferase [uncultured Aquitalea sp.]